MPTGLTIDTSTGDISGTIPAGTSADGPFTTTVTASDGTNNAAQTFTWNVNSSITLTNPGDQRNNEGDTVSLAVHATDTTTGATLAYATAGLPDDLSINTTTGVISGTIPAGATADGPFVVTVTATDGTDNASQTFTWRVQSPVTLTNPGNQSNNEGDTVSLSLTATDATGGTLTYAATVLPYGVSLNTSTGVLSGTTSASGTVQATVTASDGTYSASQTFTWTVSAVGPLTLLNPGDQSNNEGDAVSLPLYANDASGATVTFAAAGLPTGLSLDTTTGVISGTLSVGAAASSPFTITVTASDGTNSDQQAFQWTVMRHGAPSRFSVPAIRRA